MFELLSPIEGDQEKVAFGEFAIAFKFTELPAHIEVEPPGVIVTEVAGLTTICCVAVLLPFAFVTVNETV